MKMAAPAHRRHPPSPTACPWSAVIGPGAQPTISYGPWSITHWTNGGTGSADANADFPAQVNLIGISTCVWQWTGTDSLTGNPILMNLHLSPTGWAIYLHCVDLSTGGTNLFDWWVKATGPTPAGSYKEMFHFQAHVYRRITVP